MADPAAFITPVLGAYGRLIHAANVSWPGSIRIDLGLTRTFKLIAMVRWERPKLGSGGTDLIAISTLPLR